MRKIKFFAMAVLVVAALASCKKEDANDPKEDAKVTTTTIDFEDVTLDATGVWNGSDLTGEAQKEESWGSEITNYYGSFKSGICAFNNVYTAEWFSWTGFACSNNVDTVTAGYTNQYSVQAAAGANGSKQFAVAYNEANFDIAVDSDKTAEIVSAMLCNSTYAFRSLAYAENYCKVLEDGDYFKVIMTGTLQGDTVGMVEYYLADYRDGKKFINNNWETVDLTQLGTVDNIAFSFEGTDNSVYGLNTPTYVCIDNIKIKQTKK